MNTCKTIFVVIITLFVSKQMLAHELLGSVKDQEGKALSRVDILNLSRGVHTHSDDLGLYRISSAHAGDTIQFTHLGFQPYFHIVIEADERLDIVMVRSSIQLDQVSISPRLDATSVFAEIDLRLDPVNSAQEILQQVPGLFIGQHAGGGKAEQIFLRGFDIDHGTDLAIQVDGMPVNMVSHAHGQGYADLHFLIPESIERVDFAKGPYTTSQGNFSTAGHVNFRTRSRIDDNILSIQGGQFDTRRLLGGFKLLDTKEDHVYIMMEDLRSDGPFESSQHFRRQNVLLRSEHVQKNGRRLRTALSHFASSWDASGQVPQRAIDQGLITRFGAIDDTEGGETSRTNAQIEYAIPVDPRHQWTTMAYYSHYDFELYSNFTFFLEDSINGDQIRQREARDIFGLHTRLNGETQTGKVTHRYEIGLQHRQDLVRDNELSNTRNREETLLIRQLGDIDEQNTSAYLDWTMDFGKWRVNTGVRYDNFEHGYSDALTPAYDRRDRSLGLVSPKVSILFNPNRQLQLYVKGGRGFHSNDSRVVTAPGGLDVLPSAWGSDQGLVWKPLPRLLLNAALWQLYLEQEFVYVGDAGIVEPSGETYRQGVEFSMSYQVVDHLFFDVDANYTYARSLDAEDGEDLIPLAPDLTALASIAFIPETGWFASARVRYMDDRQANEDNSIVAEGYTVVDMSTGYRWNKVEVGVDIENLLDVDWNETQFATESRLRDEVEPVEEIHFTPGTPFFLRGRIAFRF